MSRHLKILLGLVFLGLTSVCFSQTESGSDPKKDTGDLALVEKLIAARGEYQLSMEMLRSHYVKVGDVEKAKWAEQELLAFHRTPKRAFRLELDVPPSTLRGTVNIPAANKLYIRATSYQGRGWGTDYVDNQRRAELLFQQLLAKYPQSSRISDAAYQLGDIYEKNPYNHYRRAALYFERCYQWNPTTQFDARIRAARIYDRNLVDRNRAIEIYQEVTRTEADPTRIQEAVRRMDELRQRR